MAATGAGAGIVIIWARLGGPSELGAEGKPTSALLPCGLHRTVSKIVRAPVGAGAEIVVIWALLGGSSRLGAEGMPTSALLPCSRYRIKIGCAHPL